MTIVSKIRHVKFPREVYECESCVQTYGVCPKNVDGEDKQTQQRGEFNQFERPVSGL